MISRHNKNVRESGFGGGAKAAETLEISASSLGQVCPQDCPQSRELDLGPYNALGPAMNISQVAEMLGCSPWTVRHRYLRQGLPHLRPTETGRLVFFHTQVIAWILKRQQKGGKH